MGTTTAVNLEAFKAVRPIALSVFFAFGAKFVTARELHSTPPVYREKTSSTISPRPFAAAASPAGRPLPPAPQAMKFGKKLQHQVELAPASWRDHYLAYTPLKQLLKKLSPEPAANAAVEGGFVALGMEDSMLPPELLEGHRGMFVVSARQRCH